MVPKTHAWSQKHMHGPKNTCDVPVDSFSNLLFRYDVSVNHRSHKLNVVSIAKGTASSFLQQICLMSWSCLSVQTKTQYAVLTIDIFRIILESVYDAISCESSSFSAGLFSLACDEAITKKLFTTSILETFKSNFNLVTYPFA